MNKIEPKSSLVANYSASSSSSSAGPQCTPLSSFTFNQSHQLYLNPDHLTASLFFRQPESESHALNRLFSRELLEELESWFVEYKVGHGICWIDLLGLRCYDLLKQMEKVLDKQGPVLQPITQEWSALYLLGCISLINSLEVTTESRYFYSIKQFAQKLGTIDSRVGKECSNSIAQLRRTKTNPKIRKAMEEKIQDLEKKWQMASKLFGRFLLLPNSRPFLTDFTLAECLNAPFLVPTTLKEREIALDNLIMSIEMHETAMKEAGKRKWIGAIIPFPNMVASLKAMRPVLGSQEKLLKASENFFEQLTTFRKMAREGAFLANGEANQAKNGDLTYALWCEKHGIPSKAVVSQSTFIEQMVQKQVMALLYLQNSFDYQSIMENCILQSPENDSRARHTRVRLTLEQVLETKEAPTTDPQRREIYNAIEKNLLNVSQLKFFQDFIDKESINHNALAGFECQDIHKLSLFFKNAANDFLKSIQTDPLTSERSPLSQDELNFFAKVFVLAHDLEILTKQGKLTVVEESEIFPDEFIKLFTDISSEEEEEEEEEEESSISGIDSLPTIAVLNLPSSPDLEKSEPTIDTKKEMPSTDTSLSLDPPPIPAPSLKQSHPMLSTPLGGTIPNQRKKTSLADKAAGEVKRSKPLLKESKKEQKPQQSALNESTPLPENVSAILDEPKRRKIERILRSLGLKPLPNRGRGSHTVWRDPQHQWGQTVIPTHDELAEGTRRSIVDQLAHKKEKS